MTDNLRGPAGYVIREAVPEDGGLLLRWVKKLAEFERLSDSVTATVEDYERAFFGTGAIAHALFVESVGDSADRTVGFAVWNLNYSTFSGRPGIYLEDLFIDEAHRGKGLATAVFDWLAAEGARRGCARLEWQVLDWNERAIGFYRARGSEPKPGWVTYRKTLT